MLTLQAISEIMFEIISKIIRELRLSAADCELKYSEAGVKEGKRGHRNPLSQMFICIIRTLSAVEGSSNIERNRASRCNESVLRHM